MVIYAERFLRKNPQPLRFLSWCYILPKLHFYIISVWRLNNLSFSGEVGVSGQGFKVEVIYYSDEMYFYNANVFFWEIHQRELNLKADLLLV